MATKTDNTIIPANDTDAHFRACAQFIHDVFGLAWTQTSDTGQITIASATRPLAANTSQGGEMWKMADSLQSTDPVFVKIEYGSGSAANNFGIWITIGTGSDGANAVTGVLLARTQIAASGNSTTVAQMCFGSAASNRVNFAMFTTTNTIPFWLAIERTKVAGTTTGADSDQGLILAYGLGTSGHKSQVLPFAAVAPTAESGLQFILSTNNPTAYTGDQGIGLMIPMLGVAIQPGLNVCVTMGNDFAEYAQPSFTLYGASHTYQHMGNRMTTFRAGNADSLTRLLLLHE